MSSIQIKSSLFITVIFLFFIGTVVAQDLDPRSYVWVPVRANVAISGFAFSSGAVVTDPTAPLDNLKVKVETPSLGYMRSFGLLGKTATAFAVLPYSFVQGSADINGQYASRTFSGISDMRMRLSVLLLGAPATPVTGFAKVKQKTILGFSLTMSAPTGQHFANKLINIGTNRWSFKPELGLSQPLGKKWLIDVYTGVWVFTNNNQFYPGTLTKAQDPMLTIQAHISYNVKKKMWLALDGTYYVGGQSTIEGTLKDDRQSNSRIGMTMLVPVGKKSSLKIAASTGAIIRSGANFKTLSIGWQTTWFGKKNFKKS